jgi:septal ring factor EnvC (AmiA/AmiB activator)
LTELVNESNKKLIEASQEIERLGLALRTRNEEKNQLEAKLKQLSQENEYLKQTLQRVNV